jgi:hypothetical protein
VVVDVGVKLAQEWRCCPPTFDLEHEQLLAFAVYHSWFSDLFVYLMGMGQLPRG